MLRMLVLAAALAALAGASAMADDDDDREEMLDARRSGTILPLAEILDRLGPRISDRILEIEFDREDGKAVYEIYFVDARGRRRVIEVDAATAEILDMEKDD
jgi:uncharacterized membrane protein YkoI